MNSSTAVWVVMGLFGAFFILFLFCAFTLCKIEDDLYEKWWKDHTVADETDKDEE